MKAYLKLFAILLAVALIAVFSFTATADTADTADAGVTLDTTGLTQIAENSKSALYVNLDTANFYFYDKIGGQTYSAVPDGADSTFSSMIKISYMSGGGVVANISAPGVDSGFEIKKIEDGLKIIFTFSSDNTKFKVPMNVKLGEGYIDVSIPFSEIKEGGDSRITDIELLPNFMYGSADEDGYVLIPDGSGAIINYSESRSRNESYSARVYGNDPCQDLIFPIITDAKTALLPVYGAKRGNGALFGVITSGDVFATVNATMVADSLIAYPSFIFRERDMTGLQQSGGGKRTLDILQSITIPVTPGVRFYSLSGTSADYSGMANCYRNYLIEEGTLKDKVDKAPSAVSVMAFGAAPEKKVIFGIPVTTVKKATDFEELNGLYTALTEDGGEAPSFYLYGFLDGGYGAKTLTKPKYIGKLGGKKGYESFVEAAGKDKVFTVYNTERSYGRSFDFLRFKDYMSSLNQTSVKVHYRSPASGRWHKTFGAWSFYTVKYQQKLVSKLINKLPADSSVVFEHYGEELLSDFTSDASTTRQDYLNFIKQALKKTSDKGINIALEGGNACIVGSADELYGIPLTSSGFAIESYSIPFYTMVFHGYKKLSTTPTNLESNSAEFALRAFEAGISATYAVSGEDSHEFKDTVFNFLYNSKIENLLPAMKKYIKDYSEIHKTLASATVTRHDYEGDLSITEYEDGTKLVCNYGEAEETYNNIKIAPQDFTVIR